MLWKKLNCHKVIIDDARASNKHECLYTVPDGTTISSSGTLRLKKNYALKQSAAPNSHLISISIVPIYIITRKHKYVYTFANNGENSLADSKHISSNFSITSIYKVFKKNCYHLATE